ELVPLHFELPTEWRQLRKIAVAGGTWESRQTAEARDGFRRRPDARETPDEEEEEDDSGGPQDERTGPPEPGEWGESGSRTAIARVQDVVIRHRARPSPNRETTQIRDIPRVSRGRVGLTRCPQFEAEAVRPLFRLATATRTGWSASGLLNGVQARGG